jgi:hypothetical protein
MFSKALVVQEPKLNGHLEDVRIADDVQPGKYGAVAGANNISPVDGQVRNQASFMWPEYVL